MSGKLSQFQNSSKLLTCPRFDLQKRALRQKMGFREEGLLKSRFFEGIDEIRSDKFYKYDSAGPLTKRVFSAFTVSQNWTHRNSTGNPIPDYPPFSAGDKNMALFPAKAGQDSLSAFPDSQTDRPEKTAGNGTLLVFALIVLVRRTGRITGVDHLFHSRCGKRIGKGVADGDFQHISARFQETRKIKTVG